MDMLMHNSRASAPYATDALPRDLFSANDRFFVYEKLATGALLVGTKTTMPPLERVPPSLAFDGVKVRHSGFSNYPPTAMVANRTPAAPATRTTPNASAPSAFSAIVALRNFASNAARSAAESARAAKSTSVHVNACVSAASAAIHEYRQGDAERAAADATRRLQECVAVTSDSKSALAAAAEKSCIVMEASSKAKQALADMNQYVLEVQGNMKEDVDAYQARFGTLPTWHTRTVAFAQSKARESTAQAARAAETEASAIQEPSMVC